MPTHTTISGHRIDYDEPEPAVAAFFERLQAMAADPKVSENEMIGLAYSRENPILDHTLFPERGAVTKEVLANPLYQVMADLLARKRIALEGVDVAELAAEYSIGVAEAAKRLGITESAVRQAILARRLPSWVKDGGKYFVSERGLEGFQLVKGGPERADLRSEAEKARARRAAAPRAPDVDQSLRVRVGSAGGKRLRVKCATELERAGEPDEGILEGTFPSGWTRVGVLVGSEDRDRFFELEPAAEENEIAWGPFYVRGRFHEVRRENNARRAREEWKLFRAS